jgi:hypothetical protein
MAMDSEEARLAGLKIRADKLGYEIEPSIRRPGYCLWRSWPGIGRQMILGRDGGVMLDAIAQKLDEMEVDAGTKKSGS